MPKIKCSSIKRNGVQCASNAKDNGRCGVHKNHDVQESKLNLRRRVFFIYMLDEANAIPRQLIQGAGWIPHTVEEGLEHISVIEGLIRPQYDWTRDFTEDKRREIDNSRRITDRQRAERRIPAFIRHQIRLMHDWYIHIHNILTNPERATRITMTLDQLYNDGFIAEQLEPWVRANWEHLDHVQQRELRRAVVNMRILGQIGFEPIGRVLPPAPVRAVIEFITDNQNVHRKDTVSYIENVFKQLKKIVVPETQRTLGEILVNCDSMKPEAQIQMVKMYHAGDSIYEHKRAYPRALDAVWAFITRHDNKKELYTRVSQEMNDNIGMCAQGNLSRICNILCGYIEGFQPPVPQGTLVQNKMAAIAMDSEGNKIGRAKDALRELLVPESEWGPWIEAFDE